MRNSVRGGQEIGGPALPPGHAWHSPGPPVRRLMPFFGRKKANFWRKIWAKVSIQSELRISIYIRNGERAESGAQKQRETERHMPWGARRSHAMEAKDYRGNPSPI